MTPSADAARLFLALWPGAGLARALHRQGDGWRWVSAARRTPLANLHMTLHFIGPVPLERVGAVEAGLEVASGPMEFVLDGAAVWHGGIAVVTAQDPPAALVALHARLATALKALDLPVEERPFRPHVTLARRAAGTPASRDGLPLRWEAEPGYALVRSLPGGRYLTLRRYG